MYTINQLHTAPSSKTAFDARGILAEQSGANITGLISVAGTARNTDASQSHKAILLSQQARALSEPHLEIQTNHVRCKHASACGTLDWDSLIYLQIRGVTLYCAKRLLLQSFLQEYNQQLAAKLLMVTSFPG
jgi:Fe-S cluster assembly protein SufD